MRDLGFSRADFWALAAVEALDFVTEDAQSRNGCTITYASITSVINNYSSAAWNWSHSKSCHQHIEKQPIIRQVGEYPKFTSWVQRQKQFSNQYFIDMFDSSLGEGDDAEGLKKESSISMGRYQVSKTAMGKVLQHFTFQTTCADQL